VNDEQEAALVAARSVAEQRLAEAEAALAAAHQVQALAAEPTFRATLESERLDEVLRLRARVRKLKENNQRLKTRNGRLKAQNARLREVLADLRGSRAYRFAAAVQRLSARLRGR
jgi:hypothetical protein